MINNNLTPSVRVSYLSSAARGYLDSMCKSINNKDFPPGINGCFHIASNYYIKLRCIYEIKRISQTKIAIKNI